MNNKITPPTQLDKLSFKPKLRATPTEASTVAKPVVSIPRYPSIERINKNSNITFTRPF